ncbi:MAG: L-ribulose-5-phosphate 4-epimerase [Bacteroidales bacterium]|nr:L-ribulose-5-phosphate 4-epimerase [Bacteroidales bacterium]MBN2632626.1 L-ribulose-5-phosphate 4-epimerase [Bacteroidales bacterium]
MLDTLKITVYRANLDLVNEGLVIQTWGNVSGRDNETGLIVIKPSGLSYKSMKPDDLVVIDMEGNVVEGKYRPSTDAPTHLMLYREFASIGGIVHTHSTYATSWAQAGRDIPAFGTTHADHFYGMVPCTRKLTEYEVHKEYESNTGKVIIERLGIFDPLAVPSVLVNSHGPFSWGIDAEDAVNNAVALEEIARMAFYTVLLGQREPVDKYLLDKHFSRKHGKDAYYGQKKEK